MSLRIGSALIEAPPLPSGDDCDVQAWRLPDGPVWAYAHHVDSDRWLQLPSVGSFLLGGAADTITAFPEPGVPEEALCDAYRRIVLPIAFQAHGGEVLHASAVRAPAGVVALCADSQGGKSTTAFALSRRGFRLWADDALGLEFTGGGVAAVMLPFVLRLRPASARHFFGTERAADHMPAAEDDGAHQPPAPLAAVFFLERVGRGRSDSVPEATRVKQSYAFARALAQAGCFTLQDPRRKELMMRHYLELSASVPFFTLRVPAGFDQLGDALDCIETTLAEQPRSAVNAAR